jgi:hypothetical protein
MRLCGRLHIERTHGEKVCKALHAKPAASSLLTSYALLMVAFLN